MVIGTAMKPRSFRKKTGYELGLDYHSNKKARMTPEPFLEWIRRFSRYISRKPGRKELVLFDNCSAHGKKENMPQLDNVRLECLPPNTTRLVQPVDVGIIELVKRKNSWRMLFRIFENIEASQKLIYNVAVLTAIRWTYEEWSTCPGHHSELFI